MSQDISVTVALIQLPPPARGAILMAAQGGQVPGLCASQAPPTDALHCLMVFFQSLTYYLG